MPGVACQADRAVQKADRQIEHRQKEQPQKEGEGHDDHRENGDQDRVDTPGKRPLHWHIGIEFGLMVGVGQCGVHGRRP
jgi:hypothetical protein